MFKVHSFVVHEASKEQYGLGVSHVTHSRYMHHIFCQNMAQVLNISNPSRLDFTLNKDYIKYKEPIQSRHSEPYCCLSHT